MAFATLTQTSWGTILRLTNRGFTVATLPVPARQDEDPTGAVGQAIAGQGFTRVQSEWERFGSVWAAEVEPTDTPDN